MRRTSLPLAALVSALCLVLVAPSAPSAGAANRTRVLHGEFVVVAADAARVESMAYFVDVGDRLYRIDGKDHYRFETGQPVTVSGAVSGETIEAPTVEATGPAPAPAAAVTPTSANVLVQLVYWTSPDSSVTPADARRQYAETSSDWFRSASYGRFTSMTATATDWMPIPAPPDPDAEGTSTPCDNIGEIQAASDSAAQAAGYDLAGFTHFVYYYPTCPGEMWGGWGEVGSNHTWLIGEMSTRVAVHELGHNFGLGHSRTQYCTQNGVQVTNGATCEIQEYGDFTSAMGGGGSGQGMFSANQQAYLGWLGNQTHAITDVSTSGTYTLAPIESQAGGNQALRIVDSSGTTFWVEYRQPQGVDAFLWDGLTGGVLIKSGPDDVSYAESTLYDMTPSEFGDFSDAALPVGRSWSNPLGDLSVHVDSADPTGATVSVALGEPTLSVVRTGKGSGTVTSTTEGIDCGPDCAANYPLGSEVTLAAAPDRGSSFTGWSGACTGTGVCTVSMTDPRTVIARFAGPACTIRGTAGPDVLTGTRGDDVICGGVGNDTLLGQGGDDTLVGGPGSDSASYARSTAPVTVDLATGTAVGQGNDSLLQIENLLGSPRADALDGSTGVNTLRGGGGDDHLAGRAGDDRLFGGGGRDALMGGGGSDACDGGPGTDTASTCESRVSVP